MRTLADVLPSAALAIARKKGPLPKARTVVVMLVDGLGDELLRASSGHAPFLRRLRENPYSTRLSSGFPSTTATSLGMLGTGLPPGAHGLVALDVLDPARDKVFNELMWDPEVDPRQWQPAPTVFEQVVASGRDVVRIGPGYFDGSGLTEAVQRGGRFVAAQSLDQRVEVAIDTARRSKGALIYLYWGDLDKIGHEQGCRSWNWTGELERVDAGAQALAAGLPADCLLVVTADHGMVDVPFENRLDIAHEPELLTGVRHLGGEPRSLQLYCEAGATDDVAAAWQARMGSDMTVVTRAQAVDEGWFGPVAPHVLPRIGDVVTAATGEVAVVDSRTARPQVLRLLGLHGSRTSVETQVPLLVSQS
ncbi:alkaline phosphatase family protein [Kineosporia rhizophila]|uniref:alkaline phosphatase family protein n=1 Tax=Kineosporia TaxID=49184 RepID=UPI001E513E66|nr:MULTISPECIES: alkaline phosphatase family protein [Kineosporia]MCE0537326.1 alkaline phosphatase family protein [Kineosporia rhizophila]GLY17529.1 alkaline phosphatase family protein [Kineosporia sp. NBRC 101677]